MKIRQRGRGAFLSAKGAVQALSGPAAGRQSGLLLSTDAAARIAGYGMNGRGSVGLAAEALFWLGCVGTAGNYDSATAAQTVPKRQPELMRGFTTRAAIACSVFLTRQYGDRCNLRFR